MGRPCDVDAEPDAEYIVELCPTPDKKCFTSRKHARNWDKHFRRSHSAAKRLWPYECPAQRCGYWHLTSDTPAEQELRRLSLRALRGLDWETLAFDPTEG